MSCAKDGALIYLVDHHRADVRRDVSGGLSDSADLGDGHTVGLCLSLGRRLNNCHIGSDSCRLGHLECLGLKY